MTGGFGAGLAALDDDGERDVVAVADHPAVG